MENGMPPDSRRNGWATQANGTGSTARPGRDSQLQAQPGVIA